MLKNKFKRMMVPLDGSPNSVRGLDEAVSLAVLGSSQITGVHVLPVYPKNLVGTFDTYVAYKSKLSKEFLEKAKTSAVRNGVEFSQKILFGNDTVRLITNYAKTSKSDIIVLGSRGKGDPKAGFLGSVSSGILYGSKISVMIIK